MLSSSSTAMAQEQETTDRPITVSGDIAVVSDYRFRGVSLSDKKAAVQGGVTLESQPGFYAGVWASNIADYGGANTEIDLTAGWAGAVGPLTADVSVVGFMYPGGEAVNYYELYGSLGKEFGPLSTRVGLAWSPRQDNIGGVSNTYVYGEAEYALPRLPVTLSGRVGYEDGVYHGKTDYTVGASVDLAPFTLGVSYITVDSDARDGLHDLAGDTALVSLSAGF